VSCLDFYKSEIKHIYKEKLQFQRQQNEKFQAPRLKRSMKGRKDNAYGLLSESLVTLSKMKSRDS